MSHSTTPLEFSQLYPNGKFPVEAAFDGGLCTSDAGALIVRQVMDKVDLAKRLAGALTDTRDPDRVLHSNESIFACRIVALCLGYEDGIDIQELKFDPALRAAMGVVVSGEKATAPIPRRMRRARSRSDRTMSLPSQPTISRFENRVTAQDNAELAKVLLQFVTTQIPLRSKRVVIEVDGTEVVCHGEQEDSRFNGYYDSTCYSPLLVHVRAENGERGENGRRWLAAILQRPGDAAPGTDFDVALGPVIDAVAKRCPKAHILVCCDGGFGHKEGIEYCQSKHADFVLGYASNSVVKALALPLINQTRDEFQVLLNELGPCDPLTRNYRQYGEFHYAAQTWSEPLRIVVKAGFIKTSPVQRYVVTSLPAPGEVRVKNQWESEIGGDRGVWTADEIYKVYAQRGDQENQIKQFKLDMAGDRTSCMYWNANQFRLILHAVALFVMGLISAVLAKTRFAKATPGTIREKLLKVGARFIPSTRRLRIQLPSSFRHKDIWFLLNQKFATPQT